MASERHLTQEVEAQPVGQVARRLRRRVDLPVGISGLAVFTSFFMLSKGPESCDVNPGARHCGPELPSSSVSIQSTGHVTPAWVLKTTGHIGQVLMRPCATPDVTCEWSSACRAGQQKSHRLTSSRLL